MLEHAYGSYMAHGYPWDEVLPLKCTGRRWDRRTRGDLDDILGGFSMTLVDSLDMLLVAGRPDEFAAAVERVSRDVTFDRDVTVSVFETTIRVLGGLLSAHTLAAHPALGLRDYDDGLLTLALDLGNRLLPAFDTPTGIPAHRVNLRHGLLEADLRRDTCVAAAGTLLLEFGLLSRLTGIYSFERAARGAVLAIWERRSRLDLVGANIDVRTGRWTQAHTGIGAGVDSFYEYLLKAHIVFRDEQWLDMFERAYAAALEHLRVGDFYFEVAMAQGAGSVRSYHVSSLQAFWPGMQVLAGDVADAAKGFRALMGLWDKHGGLPELYDVHRDRVAAHGRGYPLRPELVESAYHLFRATGEEQYLVAGRKVLRLLQDRARVECGFAAIADVTTGRLDDRMDSFIISETLKYLFLLFDAASGAPQSFVHDEAYGDRVMFTTEGHVLILDEPAVPSRPVVGGGGGHEPAAREKAGGGGEPLPVIVTVECPAENDDCSVTSVDFARFPRLQVAVGDEQLEVEATGAKFGPPLPAAAVARRTPMLLAAAPGDACAPLTAMGAAGAGAVVAVQRGGCPFVTKVRHAQEAGAVGALVLDLSSATEIEVAADGSAAPAPAPEQPPPLMADDGSGGDIRIPAALAPPAASQLIFHVAQAAAGDAVPVYARMWLGAREPASGETAEEQLRRMGMHGMLDELAGRRTAGEFTIRFS